jgi:[protein-PII] uridylyltransferase
VAVDRTRLFADTRRGSAWCREHAAVIDGWLRSLFTDAAGGRAIPAALVAIGGYGRGELCPHSDIDVLLVHDRGGDVAGVADRIWYPIWDEGIHLGHKVATIGQALSLAEDDLDTATALLSVRCIAGDEALAVELRDAAAHQWRARSKKWLTQLSIRVRERHAGVHEVAFALEPDLKDGRGGLRDVHALWWAHAARPVLDEADSELLTAAYETLLAVRVELHRLTGRPNNTLLLEERDGVARALDLPETDALMSSVAEAGRLIAWHSDEAWRRIALALRGPLGRRAARPRRLADGIDLRDGEVHVSAAAAAEPDAVLRVAVHAANASAALSREALRELDARAHPVEPWSPEARDALVTLLLSGRRAIPVIEALDHARLWSRLVLPEWSDVHARPQHNPFHRYTVDRHTLEAVANGARLATTVERPDLLVLAALLHDLGKGHQGDHTDVGVGLARSIASRLGFAPADVDTVVALVANHLLLVDVATRRDLDDPATIARVADAVRTRAQLRLLAALTEADARATGPAAWTPWRAELVALLVDRVDDLLAGGSSPVGRDGAALGDDPAVRAALAVAERRIDAGGDTITVVADDRPGTFSRIAGVLALHGLEVIAADALSTDNGAAVSRFRVTDPLRGDPPWPKAIRDIELALDGRLALAARLDERARRYTRPTLPTPRAASPTVTFDDDASPDATVIDVHAADATAVLYRITRALADLDLDIRSAKVQTIGHEVVDAFYVRDRNGRKLTQDALRGEITRAIQHELTR